jgi:membrane protein DedA with SNARE-associated domain
LDLSAILEAIAEWVKTLIATFGYPGLILAMVLENIFPPVPSEIVLPLAGSMSAGPEFTLLGVVLAGTLGSVLGAWILYLFGQQLGEPGVRLVVRRYGKWMLVSEKDLDRSLDWFSNKGELVVFFARMVPGLRSIISVPAGMVGMSPLRFTLYTALGAGIWSFLLALAGRLLGDNWPVVGDYLSRYQNVVVLMAVAVLALLVMRRLAGRQLKQT